MGAPNCTAKVEMKKGSWTLDEDQKLLAYIEKYGHGCWRSLPASAGLDRCGKSCRLRWTNYLRPDIKRGKFSTHEENSIIRLHALLGNRWSAIAIHLPKRTDNEIKNYWNARLKKRLIRMGIDPATHKPRYNPAGSADSSQAATLSHMAQWEAVRLEAEDRLARESKLVPNDQQFHIATAPTPPPPLRPQCLDVLKVWQAISIPSCFSSSPGALESPNFTINFSSNDLAVPTVSSNTGNDVVCAITETKVKIDNSLQIHDDSNVYAVGYDRDMAMDSIDHDSFNRECMGPVVTEYDDTRNWNELLNLVRSRPTVEWPTL